MTHESSWNGIIPVNKPSGMVSKDVSRLITRCYRRLKIGHVGTLDPMAEGVLVLVVGKAVRLQDHLVAAEKEYLVDVELGYETDSLDAEGQVVKRSVVPGFESDDVRRILEGMQGDWLQTPPLYSALKHKGRPLYDYARKGLLDQVDLSQFQRTVQLKDLELVAATPVKLTIRIVCSQGTYVRSVAQAVAAQLGTCGTATRIVRLRAAGVHLEDCVDVATLEKHLLKLGSLVKPIDEIPLRLAHWFAPRRDLVDRLRMGQCLSLETEVFGSCVKKYADQVGVGRDILLVSDQGDVFGIGRSSSDGLGRTSLAMRREL